jgi:hypothetical protein
MGGAGAGTKQMPGLLLPGAGAAAAAEKLLRFREYFNNSRPYQKMYMFFGQNAIHKSGFDCPAKAQGRVWLSCFRLCILRS